MHRVVIFSSRPSGIPELLVRNAILNIAERDDAIVVAVCVSSHQQHLKNLCIHTTRKTIASMRRLVRRDRPWREVPSRPASLHRLSRRLGFKILTPPEDNINNPQFIERLKTEFKPTTALSLYCLQRFSPALLEAFDDTVNFHNGLLPAYRGIRATAWSLYNGEEQSGFTFHRMTEAIDQGPILKQHSVTVDPRQNTNDVEWQKARVSATCLGQVFRKLNEGDPGQDQCGEARYYSKSDMESMVTIEDPANYSSQELERRLRSFLALNFSLQGRAWQVTQIRAVGKKPWGLAPTFTTADGKTLRISRVEYLPYSLFRLQKFIRAFLP